MSWDVFVQDLPGTASSVDEIPDDFRPRPLGPRAEIIEAIKRAVPWADFSDPSWGRIDAADYSVEVNLGEDGMVGSFALHARGSQKVVEVVRAILAELELRALDPGSPSGIIGPLDETGWKRWSRYRAEVIGP